MCGFLTSYSVFCQVQVADLEKINSGSINKIYGSEKKILKASKSLLSHFQHASILMFSVSDCMFLGFD